MCPRRRLRARQNALKGNEHMRRLRRICGVHAEGATMRGNGAEEWCGAVNVSSVLHARCERVRASDLRECESWAYKWSDDPPSTTAVSCVPARVPLRIPGRSSFAVQLCHWAHRLRLGHESRRGGIYAAANARVLRARRRVAQRNGPSEQRCSSSTRRRVRHADSCGANFHRARVRCERVPKRGIDDNVGTVNLGTNSLSRLNQR